MSAAHCLDGARSVEICAGAHNWAINEPEQQTVVATRFSVHENWNSFNLHNDIALAKLDSPLALSKFISALFLFLCFHEFVFSRRECSAHRPAHL